MADDNRIIELIAWHKAITRILRGPITSAYERLMSELDEAEKELANLTLTTGPAAVELLDPLSEHDDRRAARDRRVKWPGRCGGVMLHCIVGLLLLYCLVRSPGTVLLRAVLGAALIGG